MSKCPHCGAEVQYSVKKKKVHCEYCGSDFNVSELVQDAKTAKEVKKEMISGKSYLCSQCGATLLSFDETAVTFCSYCGSQNVLEDKLIKQTAPDVIIPFSRTKDECINNYMKKVGHFIFSPKYMKSDLVAKKFRGIYMPYGIYTLQHNGDCINKGKKYSHKSGNYDYYDDYDIHAQVDASYDGISFDLMSKFYDEYSHTIPFDYHGAVPFNSNYLPGFYADCKDVEFETYSNEAIQMGETDSTRFLKKKRTYLKYACYSPIVKFDMKEQKIGYFPVYFASIRDKSNEHIYYAIINGQTGKVAADLPIDFMKYVIFSLILTIPIFILVNYIPTILPDVIDSFTVVMSIVALFICSSQLNACNKREARSDDKGYTYIASLGMTDAEKKKFKRKRIPKKYKMKKSTLLKFVGAAFIPVLPILVGPVSDMPYYAAAIVGLILILLSFRDLVSVHNILVARPIPQLEKRGGDESE